MTSLDIELALARYFGILPKHGGMGNNRNMIIPNFRGMYMHECDLFVLTESGYAWEIEIKVTLADLKADLKKRHGHKSKWTRFLYYAMPEIMKEYVRIVPKHAGIYLIDDDGGCECLRKAITNSKAQKLPIEAQLHCGRVAAMRIWTLKKKLKEKS
jgi:hypothetical protein